MKKRNNQPLTLTLTHFTSTTNSQQQPQHHQTPPDTTRHQRQSSGGGNCCLTAGHSCRARSLFRRVRSLFLPTVCMWRRRQFHTNSCRAEYFATAHTHLLTHSLTLLSAAVSLYWQCLGSHHTLPNPDLRVVLRWCESE